LSKTQGGILGFMPTSPELETPLLMVHVSYISVSNRVGLDEQNLLLFDLSAPLWPEIWAVKVREILPPWDVTTFMSQPLIQILTVFDEFDFVG